MDKENYIPKEEDIIQLKKECGAGFGDCKLAVTLAQGDLDVAFKFLDLKSSAVSRYKFVDGVRYPFTDEDYLELAKKRVDKEKDNEKDIEM